MSVIWLSQRIKKFPTYFFIFTQTRKESVLTTSALWRFPNWAILPHCNFPLAYPAPDTQSPFCFSRLNPSHPYKFQGPIEKPSLIILYKIFTSVYFLSYHTIVFSQNRDFSYLVYILYPVHVPVPGSQKVLDGKWRDELENELVNILYIAFT